MFNRSTLAISFNTLSRGILISRDILQSSDSSSILIFVLESSRLAYILSGLPVAGECFEELLDAVRVVIQA